MVEGQSAIYICLCKLCIYFREFLGGSSYELYRITTIILSTVPSFLDGVIRRSYSASNFEQAFF